jgi:hypothetical protein
MKIIEKSCPNCGAGLEFKKEDKTVKCSYCKKTYAVVPDREDYALEMMKGTQTAIKGIFIATAVVFVCIAITMMLMFGGIFNGISSLTSNASKEITTLNDISEDTAKSLHIESKEVINNYSHLTIGIKQTEPFTNVGMYLLIDKTGNTIYDVYKGAYELSGTSTPVYVAVRYDNVENKGTSFGSDMLNGQFFGEMKQVNGRFVFGFTSNEDLYDSMVATTAYEKMYAEEGLYKR